MRLFSRFPEVEKGLRLSRLINWAKPPKAILFIGLVALFLCATGREAVLSPTTARAGQEDVDKLANPLVLYLPILALVDPPPTSPTSGSYLPLLARQTSCSLRRQVLDPSLNLEAQYTYPAYQDFLRQITGLTSTGDK